MMSTAKPQPIIQVRPKHNIAKILTSAVAGLAGGCAIGSFFTASMGGAVIIGLGLAAFTGYSEYARERDNDKDRDKE